MWIIPSTHPLYSVYAQECLVSKEDLKEQSDQLESQLMWRSKPLSLQIWSRKWSKVNWLQHLFGRMLKHSMQDCFEIRFTESLADIPAPHSVLSENRLGGGMKVTSGRTSTGTLELFSQSSVGLKTSSTTSISDTNKSNRNWKHTAIQLRREYTQRLKRVLPIHANDYLSSLWTTPAARDYKDTPGMIAQRKDGRSRVDQLARQVFFHANEAYLNSSGSNPGHLILNPAWVAQLMGTTTEKTFFVHMVIQ